MTFKALCKGSIYSVILLLFLFDQQVCAQLPVDYGLYGLWAKRAAFGSNGHAEINTSITDQDGNVYLSGKFTGTLNFADNVCDPSMSSVDALTKGQALFLMKMNSDGVYQWHIVYEVSQGIPDFSSTASLASQICDYKDGKLLFYGRLVYHGVMTTMGMQTTLNKIGSASSSALYTKPTNSSSYDRFYFQFLHVVDVTDGSTQSLISPFASLTQNLTAKFQGNNIHTIHMGWDANVYNNNNSLVSIFDLNGNQIGTDVAYPNQPYAAPGAFGCASTIIRHVTLADGRQVMVHNSYDKGPVPNQDNDNIPSYYLLFYEDDYSVRDTIFLMSDRAIRDFPHITTDNSSNTYIATNFGKSTYWDTGDPIANSNYLTDFLGSGNNYITQVQSNKVVLARMNPDYSIKWMFQIGRERTADDATVVFANDMKTIGDYTYLVGQFMGNDLDLNGKKLTNTEGGAPVWNWNFDAFYAVFDNETGQCLYAVNLGSTGSEEATSVYLSSDASQVVIGGVYRSMVFQPDPAEKLYPLTSNGTNSVGFVAVYSIDPNSTPVAYQSSFGDSPESYSTAVHHIYNCIYLGAAPNMSLLQTAPVYSVDANTAQNDDGININAVKAGDYINLNHADFKLDASGNLNVKVRVTNMVPTNDNATLIGWIDFNQNGIYDGASEASSVITVAAGVSNSMVTLIWTGVGSMLRNGTTYLRLRLTTDNMDNTQPAGLFFNGEVEDYRLDFNLLEVFKTAEASSKINSSTAEVGDTITYNIRLKNNSPVSIQVNLFDPVPGFTAYVDNSAKVGSTIVAGTQPQNVLINGQNVSSVVWPSFNLAAGATSDEYTFKVTVIDKPAGSESIFNVAYAVYNGDTITSNKAGIHIGEKPGNIKEPEDCMEDMLPIRFGAKLKWKNDTEPDRLDGFSMPLVGDLNGDGKPEIIGLGILETGAGSGYELIATGRYIVVYNGQTGEKLLKFDLRSLGGDYGAENQFRIRYEPRHNSPSKLAMADMDGDGLTEIVVTETGSNGRVYVLKPVYTDGVLTSFVKTGDASVSHKAPLTTTFNDYGAPMPYIADLNGDGTAEVIVHNKIYSYNKITGNLDLACTLEVLNNFTYPSQTTINTIVDNYAYIGRRPGAAWMDDHIPCMAVADIDGDGVLDIIAGSKVYLLKDNAGTVDLKEIVYGPTSITAQRGTNASATRTTYVSDGFTAVADIDGDGLLDVIVLAPAKNVLDISTENLLYVWTPLSDPSTPKAATYLYSYSLTGTMSFPFIGDINGRNDDYSGMKRLPEICFNGGRFFTNSIYASQIAFHPSSAADLSSSVANSGFNGTPTATIRGHIVGFTFHSNPDGSTPLHERLKLSWAMEHGDESSCTGITMFDFDADDVNELVYRDEISLRVISPGKKVYVPVSEPVDPINGVIRFRQTGINSYTGFEAPVIADVNGDGSADIVTLVHTSGHAQSKGFPYVYEADGESWAPAMPVWNQAIYYPLQIRADMTVTQNPISTLTKFVSQRPGQLVADTIQPYNVHWAQQPIVRVGNYTPILFTPDPLIAELKIVSVSTTTTTVRVKIENKGKVSSNSNMPVSFYANSISVANLIDTQPTNIDIYVGDTVVIDFVLSGDYSDDIIYVRLVDDGINFPAIGFKDCDTDNNTSLTVYIKANDDRFSIIDEEVRLEVRLNDTAYCDILPEITVMPQHGTAYVSSADSSIVYKPNNNNIQREDTLKYAIVCDADGFTFSDTAVVYIKVNPVPDNIVEAYCSGEVSAYDWGIEKKYVSNDQYCAYFSPLIGDVTGDSIVNIIVARPLGTDQYNSNEFHVLKGDDYSFVKAINTKTVYVGSIGPAAIGKVNNKYMLYIYSKSDQYITAYDIETNTTAWTSAETVGTNLSDVSMSLADFDNDGLPEVYAGNKIFDAATGTLLWKGNSNEGKMNMDDFGTASNMILSFAADVIGDAKLELIAGNEVYEVVIDRAVPLTNVSPARRIPAPMVGTWQVPNDGFTQVADINNDGTLDVIVSLHNYSGNQSAIYVWEPEREILLASRHLTSSDQAGFMSYPFIGDVDGDGYPEILVVYQQASLSTIQGGKMQAFKYSEGNTTLQPKWSPAYPISESYARTGITLFDFNQDDTCEIVYRDMALIRIIDGSNSQPVTKASFPCYSGTGYEYPVVADINNDGMAEIVTVGGTNNLSSLFLQVFSAPGTTKWAPARKVWNQYAYNAVHVNDDLTIPKIQLSPAIVFPGADGLLGTSDDIRPYNGFLMQQTMLDKNGRPLWLLPDIYPDPALTTASLSGVSATIDVGIINQGEAVIGSPIHVTLYEGSVSSANVIDTYSFNTQIMPGDTVFVSMTIPDITLVHATSVIIRVNDDGTKFPYQAECDDVNNELTISNPGLSLLMKKDATLLLPTPLQNNGTYPNPVSVLYNEHIEYKITVTNASPSQGTLVIQDTIPSYLRYVGGSATTGSGITVDSAFNVLVGSTSHDILKWTFSGVPSMDTRIVSFKATPVEGVCASQPLFINRAWVTTSNSLYFPTNYTYHQGASVGVATFSAGFGGILYNATAQMLDYKTQPRSGIVIVPDEGYRFAGWSHDEYVSLRGEVINAQSGIMHYDTLTIYGCVELHANFEPEEYPVRYYLHGSKNAETNPSVYSIKSETIILNAPQKAGDLFVGWTGSNGEQPQENIIIPKGSTGELEFYANFLYSGREDDVLSEDLSEDKIWAAKEYLYIRTQKVGSIIRIYSTEGILQKQHTITTAGEIKIRLLQGFYVVTIDSGVGQVVMIE